jgi:hypothetical protein
MTRFLVTVEERGRRERTAAVCADCPDLWLVVDSTQEGLGMELLLAFGPAHRCAGPQPAALGVLDASSWSAAWLSRRRAGASPSSWPRFRPPETAGPIRPREGQAVTAERGRGRGHRWIEIDVERARELYEQGLSLREVAAELGCGDELVRRRLHAAGYAVRGVGRPLGWRPRAK